jgi:hypothetical protein
MLIHRNEYGAKAGILPIIQEIRSRWRLRILLTGGAVVLAVGLATFVFFAWGLELLRFSPSAVILARLLCWGLLIGLTYHFLVRPFRRRVTDEQVALYLEEHEPSLQARVLGAVAAEQHAEDVKRRIAAQGGGISNDVSPSFLRRTVEQAVEQVREVEYGRRIEQRSLYRSMGVLGGLAVASLIMLLMAPPAVWSGLSALMMPLKDVVESSPYLVEVEPGDVTIPRGADQLVSAALSGFESDDVSLFVQSESGGPAQKLSMIPKENEAGFEMLLFNLQDQTTYFAEANGIRSRTYTILVEDLPFAERLDHEYNFPSYTGLEPRIVEAGRDIAALRGTRVQVKVYSTMSTPAGRLVIDDNRFVPLEVVDDTTLVGDVWSTSAASTASSCRLPTATWSTRRRPTRSTC